MTTRRGVPSSRGRGRGRGVVATMTVLSVAGWSAATLYTAGPRAESTAQAAPPDAASRPATAAGAVERGRYLVTAMGCKDCHTPHTLGDDGPVADDARMLSGHPSDMALPVPPAPQGPWIVTWTYTNTAWSGPWGVSFTANLTPDPETGLGRWTSQQFVDAIRKGQHEGNGRAIQPPMPWQVFRNLVDEDLQAIFAYLQTIPPVRNQVPEAQLASSEPAAPPSAASETRRHELAAGSMSSDPVVRGAYLVESFDCTGCHTPFTVDGRADTPRRLSGHPADMALPPPPPAAGPWSVFAAGPGSAWAGPWGRSFTANITPDPETGLGQWTEQQFVDTIRNGRHQGRGRELLPPMPWEQFRTMTDEDLKAMFAYLRTVTPVRNRVPDPVPPGSGDGR